MKNKLLRFYTGIVFLFTTSAGLAQWATQGPYGGPIYALKGSGPNIYTATDNGIFASDNGGINWYPANKGIERMTTTAIAVKGSYIFTGAYGEGVFRSIDKGMSWTKKNNGLGNYFISAMHETPSGVFTATVDGVYFSGDNANTWTLANNGLPGLYTIYNFTNVNDTVFAGTIGLGIYMTNNNGTSWSKVAGFPVNTVVYALIAEGKTVYAGTSKGVYKSVDSGMNWMLFNTGFPAQTWAQSFAIMPGYIFAGTEDEGIFVSTDKGVTWSKVNNGLPDLPLETNNLHNYPPVETMLAKGNNVLAGTGNGMYLTNNNGTSWMEANDGIVANNVVAIATAANTVYAGTSLTGMYTSQDNGNSWTRADNGLTSYQILALTSRGSMAFASAQNRKVYRSSDNGNSWVNSSTLFSSNVIKLTTDNTRVLALTGGSKGVSAAVYQSLNDGLSWDEVPRSFTGLMSAITSTPGVIYVGNYAGDVYRTTNNGSSWQNIRSNLPNIKINALLVNGSNILAGTDGNGIFLSSNGGNSWKGANSGIINKYITSLKIQKGTLYASTWGGGVYASSNNAASWTGLNNSGLDNPYINELTIQGAHLHAATDAGVYSTSVVTGIDPTTSTTEELEIFPNPSSGVVHLSVVDDQTIQLSVNNLIGELVYLYQGKPLRQIDLSSQPKGIYFISLETGSETLHRKIILE